MLFKQEIKTSVRIRFPKQKKGNSKKKNLTAFACPYKQRKGAVKSFGSLKKDEPLPHSPLRTQSLTHTHSARTLTNKKLREEEKGKPKEGEEKSTLTPLVIVVLPKPHRFLCSVEP